MKIKALRTIVGDYGRILRDGEGTVDNEVGKKLVAKGYAVEVGGKADEKVDEKVEDVAVNAETETDAKPETEAAAEKPARKPRKAKADADE